MNRTIVRTTCALALAAAVGLPPARAADAPPTRPATRPGDAPKVIQLTVHPAAFPRPALKYQLLPDLLDQIPGNAAPVYLLATELMPPSTEKELWENVDKWLDAPLADLPRRQIWANVTSGSAIHEARLAARRTHCHWEVPWRSEGFRTLLPHLQKLRSLSRLVRLQARLLIAEDNFDAAADTLQIGTALARDLNDEPFLIQILVGVSIEASMLTVVDDWVRQPGSPNLYWALTALPRPFADIAGGMAFERGSLFTDMPQFRTAKTGRITAAEWDQLLEKLNDVMGVAGGGNGGPGNKLVLAASAMAQVPAAKKFLIDDGMPAAEVNAMEAYQVVACYWARDYERALHDMSKWLLLPYAQGRAGLAREEAAFATGERSGVLRTPLLALVPAVSRAFFTVTRVDRQIAALRCIEAIRAYAASHDGKAPASLDAVTEVPIPLDPMTGKAFKYEATESGFLLEGVTIGMQGDVLRYEVKIVK